MTGETVLKMGGYYRCVQRCPSQICLRPFKGDEREKFGKGIVDGKNGKLCQDPLLERLIHSFFNYIWHL